jgi:hypothetical protein
MQRDCNRAAAAALTTVTDGRWEEREQKMFFLFFVHCHALGLILLQLFFFITMSRMEELQYKLSEQAMLYN